MESAIATKSCLSTPVYMPFVLDLPKAYTDSPTDEAMHLQLLFRFCHTLRRVADLALVLVQPR